MYIAYILFVNLYYDPEASDFLSRKSNLKRPLLVSTWLNVMYIHVIAASLAMITGALNFSSYLLRNYRKFHRINGYLYVVFVFIVCLTSGYMAPFSTGGKINSIAFNMLNIVWPAFTLIAIIHIRRKRQIKHRQWMIRSFVFCFTNLFIHLFTTLTQAGLGLTYEKSYTVGVYGAIVFLLLLAEIVIRFTARKAAALS
ncbi:DUF2306 domain-containing protein [Paenibacillus sp. H1-7]|uniref:DUF2306 domain-containing protein n=1 Tax=Paenibacillus sp. H1-7 TaxID=2282849 RepID=UPI001EF8020F|nr:DUF2306 domain-containing protein [Paenibacillus sp. H1-7]